MVWSFVALGHLFGSFRMKQVEERVREGEDAGSKDDEEELDPVDDAEDDGRNVADTGDHSQLEQLHMPGGGTRAKYRAVSFMLFLSTFSLAIQHMT